jgi:hypothetical protein
MARLTGKESKAISARADPQPYDGSRRFDAGSDQSVYPGSAIASVTSRGLARSRKWYYLTDLLRRKVRRPHSSFFGVPSTFTRWRHSS